MDRSLILWKTKPSISKIPTVFCLGVLLGFISGTYRRGHSSYFSQFSHRNYMRIPRCYRGEFRITALIYIFSLNIVVAGTTSLLVSIPTVASGFLKYHAMGHMGKETTIMAIIMGSSSILGAFIGASYVEAFEKDILKILLGLILILVAVRMFTNSEK